MTTIKEVYDHFKVPKNQRFAPKIESIDIGDYTFTDMSKPDPFIWEFTDKNNPNILLRLNEDRNNVVLFQLQSDGTTIGTNWIYGDIKTRKFEDGYPFNKR